MIAHATLNLIAQEHEQTLRLRVSSSIRARSVSRSILRNLEPALKRALVRPLKEMSETEASTIDREDRCDLFTLEKISSELERRSLTRRAGTLQVKVHLY